MTSLEFINKILTIDGKIVRSRLRPAWLLQNYPEQYQKLLDDTIFFGDENIRLIERVQAIKQGFTSRPCCGVCCHAVKFTGGKWSRYCGYKCSNKLTANNEATKRKRQDTNIRKYGVTNPFASEKIKKRIPRKTAYDRPTKEELYQLHYIEHKRPVEIAKSLGVSSGLVEKWFHNDGVPLITKSFVRIKLPSKEDLLNFYLVEKKTKKEIAKIYEVSRDTVQNWFVTYDIETKNNYSPPTMDHHLDEIKRLHFEDKRTILQISNKLGIADVTVANILKRNGYENERFDHSGEEISLMEELAHRTGLSFYKKYLARREIDIFNDRHNLGIEYCGAYYHSEQFLDNKNYHLEKLEIARKYKFKLVTLFDFELHKKKDIVMSILCAKLAYYEHKLYARNTFFSEIDKVEAKEFLENNHLQGAGHFERAFGLLANDELVAVMTFGRHHRHFNGLVLTRLCSRRYYHISGGASKLFTNALKKLPKKTIITWSDNRWSDGNVYSQLGFKKEKEYKPDYFYIKGKNVYSKQSMQKNKINCPSDMTEADYCKQLGYYRIWDCGKVKWSYIQNG